MRGWLLLMAIVVVAGCQPRKVPLAAGDAQARACPSIAACEALLLGPKGPLPAALASYTRLRADDSLHKLWRFLSAKTVPKGPSSKDASVRVLRLHEAAVPQAIAALPRLELAGPRLAKTVSDRLLLQRWLAASATKTLVVLDPKGPTLHYSDDPLQPFMAGLFATVPTTPTRLASDLQTGKTLRRITDDMGRHAYAAAQRKASALGKQLDHGPASLRAWLFLRQLQRAGLRLTARVAPKSLAGYRAHGPYDAWLAFSLAPAAPEAKDWQKILRAALPAAHRNRLLQPQTGPRCQAAAPTHVTAPGDLVLLLRQPTVQSTTQPTATPATADAGFASAVQTALASRTPWAFLLPLLRLEAASTSPQTPRHKPLHQAAEAHLRALSAAAKSQRGALSPGALVNMMYNPGIARDPDLREPLLLLVEEQSVSGLERAPTPAAAVRAAVASFALTMSLPPEIQRGQYAALSGVLRRQSKLRFATARGWDAALLHVVQGVASFFGGATNYAATAAGVRQALRPPTGATNANPWIDLARVLSRYASLFAGDDLDATVSNPRMFSANRKRARRDLRAALGRLSSPGPSKPPEREVLDVLYDLLDGVVALAGHIHAGKERPDCAHAASIAKTGPLRDMVERLRKKRRRLLGLGGLKKAPTAWLRTARALALLASDSIDILDRSGRPRWLVQHHQAQAWLQAAPTPTTSSPLAALTSSYLVLRTLFGSTKEGSAAATAILQQQSGAALRGLGRLFQGSGRRSIFSLLARAQSSATAVAEADPFVRYARQAYAEGNPGQGDMLLLLSLTASVMRSTAATGAAIDLARQQQRPVLTALLLHERRSARAEKRSQQLRAVAKSSCEPGGTDIVLSIEKGLADFQNGRRRRGLKQIRQALDMAAQAGLYIPRQIFRYGEQAGPVVLQLEHGISFGRHLLPGSDSFRMGLGFRGQQQSPMSGLQTTLRGPNQPSSQRDSLRYYVHASAVASLLHGIVGDRSQARRFARSALSGWASGAVLGKRPYRPSGSLAALGKSDWHLLALLAEQAIAAHEPMLAGALLSLLKRSLGPAASDETLAQLSRGALAPLAELPEVAALQRSAKNTLETLMAPSRCTQKPGKAKDLLLASCSRYPRALALRIADSLPRLPRLKGARFAKSPICLGYKALDRFLAAAAERRYEPRYFSAAVTALRAGKLNDTAADLLANQRLAKHCTPALLEHARALGRDSSLGPHLRASLWSVAVRCAAPEQVAPDLLVLAQLTQKLPDPRRHFEVLVFAAKLALRGHPKPLGALVQRPGFVDPWIQRSQALGALALVLRDAGQTLVGKKPGAQAGDPKFGRICGAGKPRVLGSICSSISFLRSQASEAERRAAAKENLLRFVGTGTQLLSQDQAPASPGKR